MTTEVRLAVRQTPLTAGQRELVRSVASAVEKIARTLARRTRLAGLDELVSLGQMGAVDAAQTYDPEIGVAFEGYAWPRIIGAIRNGLERERKQMRILMQAARAASYEYAEVQTDSGDPLHDTDADTHRHFDAALDGFAASMVAGFVAEAARLTGEDAVVARETYSRAIAALGEATASLPERDRSVIDLHYSKQMELKSVATTLGISYASARRYHHGAMVRLGGRLRARGVTEAPVQDRGAV